MALGGTYNTGTVSTDADDAKKLVFTGTLLESVAVEGDDFYANGVIAPIASVDDDTTVTLMVDWAGGTLTDSAYVIVKRSWKRYDPAITQAKIREFIAYIKAQGSFLFVSGTTPDPAMGEDGQYALKTNGGPWQLWYKTGGVWEAQGIPVGTTFREAWDDVTEYFANDQVEDEGSTWTAIAGSINVKPGTDDTKWSLSAKKGADGRPGGGVSFIQTFSTSTANADPGDGMLRLNNATQSSATVIRTDYLDKDGNALNDLIGSLTDGTSTVKGQIRLAEVSDPTRWIIFDLTGKSDMTGYFNLTVMHRAHSTNPLRNGEEVGFFFGAKGDIGPQGEQGNQGYAPVLASVIDDDRRVFQVADWVGGAGTKPATGKYIGATGFVDTAAEAIDVRGEVGAIGPQGVGINPNARGTLAERDAYDDEAPPFIFMQDDVVPFVIYSKLSALTGDWSGASPIGGAGDMLASVYDPNAVEGDAFDLDNMVPAPSTVGKDVFTATDAAAARTALGIVPGMSDKERQRSSVSHIYLSKTMDATWRAADASADGFRSDAGINSGSSSNYNVDESAGLVAPTTAAPSMISAGTGTAIGNMTGSAGLSAIFDGVTNAALVAGSGTSAASSGYAGKNYSASPKRIDHVVVFASNDNGFRNSAGTIQLDLYGKNGSTPASETDGTLLGTLSFSETQNESTGRTVASTDAATAYDYVWVRGSSVGATVIGFTELQLYEAGTPNNMTVVTTAQTADASSTKARVLLEYDASAAPTLNTDITVEVTCNGGTNWSTATLASVSTHGQDGHSIAETGLTTCTAGTSIAARIKTANNKVVPVHGLVLAWE